MYFNTFHRHSWDGYDIQVRAVLDVSNWARNAAYSPRCNYFVFGDGMVTRDIVAHEFTHAITQTNAGLVYMNQSGALNESYSDVAVTAADNESGVASITYDGELSWECQTPGDPPRPVSLE